MHPKGASRNNEDHATFSNAGPYLNSPETTRRPKVIPNIYKLKSNSSRDGPKFNKETPKNGEANSTAGTIPIKVLIKAVAVRAVIISPTLRGAINRFVKFLLQISSRKSILKLMLDLNKKS